MRDFRENQQGKSLASQLAVTLVCLALGLLTTVGLGASADRSGDTTKAKIAAPTMDDHANYFAANRQGVSRADQKRADDLRVKTIASIKQLLTQKSTSKMRRFELLLRMGDLFVERADYVRDYEIEKYTLAYDKWKNGGKKGPEPKVVYTQSQGELNKGVVAFRALVADFPKHPRADAATYSLAKTLARLGDNTAPQYYNTLIKNHPKSSLIPEAHLALGEFYFDKHKIPEAMASYKEAMKYKDNRIYAYAVYKLGWAYYNSTPKNAEDGIENTKKAVTAFKLVVRLSDKDAQLHKTNMNLKQEAIKDLIMVWAETEDIDSAWEYFRTIGDQDSFYVMLERLGNIYADQGKDQKSIAVFQRLLKEQPLRSGNPLIYAKIIEMQDSIGNIPGVIADLESMQKLYLTKDGEWQKANAKDPQAIAEAGRLVELNTHRYGTIYHDRGQKSHNKNYTTAAASIYNQYLANFPENAHAYDVRYYLAEIQNEFGKYEAASANYMMVAQAKPKDGKYLKPAAVAAVASMNTLVNNTQFDKLPPPGQVPQPLEIPRLKKKLIEVIDAYVKLLPSEKDGEPMRFTATQIFFDYGNYDEAIKRSEMIIVSLPKTKQAGSSVRLVLGYYADKQDWVNVIKYGQKYRNNKDLMTPENATYVNDMLKAAMFKQALAYEKENKSEQAALAFLEFQKQFPVDGNADRALYNAGVNYFKISRVEEGLGAYKLLLQRYPKSELKPDLIVNMAETYEAIGQFESSARYYALFATEYAKDKRASAALYNAAVLYKGLVNDAKSIELFDRFVKFYPYNKLVGDALLEIAALYERDENFKFALVYFDDYAHRYEGREQERVAYARAKAAEIRTFNVDPTRGRKEFDVLKRELVKDKEMAAFDARRITAQAMFKLAEPGFREFQSLQINNGKRVEADAQRKQAKLVETARVYEGIMKIGNAEYTLAALFRLGEMHENFSTALLKAPAPEGSSQQDINKFKASIEKVAFPLRDEAYKFYETAYKQSQDVETFTVWTKKTYDKMVELQPKKHPKVLEQNADPAYMSHHLVMEDAVSGLAN